MTRLCAAMAAMGMAVQAGAQRAPAAVQSGAAGHVAAPPNVAARVVLTDSSITLRYEGGTIFEARVKGERGVPRVRQLVDSTDGRLTQVVSFVAGVGRITLRGVVHTSGDAFAVEAEPREDGVPVVRHSVGPSFNRLNRAVYARDRDWLLSVDFPAGVQVTPVTGGDSSAFGMDAGGYEVTLRFRPRFYQKHRGLAQYAPWTFKPWPVSVAGWTSWFAFKDKVTEADVHRAADVIAGRLAPFGYDVLQIDDGFQRTPISVPANWLTTNEKFPGGLDGLQSYITGKGLTAGLWTNTTFHDSTWAVAHPQYFVRNADGTPARGNWVGYVMDGANPATMRDLVDPVYAGLKKQGWRYFKVDALRHLRYEGYNANAGFYARQGRDRLAVYRSFVQRIRQDIGRDAFLLASWGPRPELAGIIDATRLGDDGFGYGGFAQYNSFNNVVWRNDPDHIEIHQADGFRAATITSLTGSLLMLTDRPEVYLTDRVEAARRTAPVLVTRPGQVYDVDPSRSRLLEMVNTEVSGAGPRPFEADQRLQQTLYQLDVARPWERWTVLARTTGAPATTHMDDLGLAPAMPYVAFDFWARRVAGVFTDSITAGDVGPLGVQVLCLRQRLAHPQLLATNRHVSCGGTELDRVQWTDDVLEGTSRVVGGDDYILWLSEPEGWDAESVAAPGAESTLGARRTDAGVRWRAVTVRSAASRAVSWTVRYRRGP
ncbi:MAG: alpha-galactosidase [Gemmatimonadaceae bacterium]